MGWKSISSLMGYKPFRRLGSQLARRSRYTFFLKKAPIGTLFVFLCRR
jgi:hypothetical protein